MEKKISLTVSMEVRSITIRGGTAGGFPDSHAAEEPAFRAQALLDLPEEVAGDDFGGGTLTSEVRELVHVLVVETRRDLPHDLLQVLEVDHDPEAVQLTARGHRLH